MVFGAKHPAVSFLLLLAIADDAIGLVIIAVFYPDPAKPVEPMWLGITVLAMLISFGLRKAKIKNFWWYLILGGSISWYGLFKAGIHPALALVFIVPFMPAEPNPEGGEGHIMEEVEGEHNTITNFEHAFKLFVDIGLLGFGLSNSGVEVEGIENLTIIVLTSLILGKTFGVFLFSNIASKLFKAPLPDGMDQKSLITAGMVASLGLTVALFVSGQAFPSTSPHQGAAKMGALLSVLGGVIAIIMGKILKIQKKN